MWESIRSFFAIFPHRIRGSRTGIPGPLARWNFDAALSLGVTIVACVADDRDRSVLTDISIEERFNLRLVKSEEETWAVMNRCIAPVVLYDRDSPDAEWKTVVQKLAASPHKACIILLSGVTDGYLWQELIRQGGYEVLAKPLRPEDTARVIKLALSYWLSYWKVPSPSNRTSLHPKS